MKSNQSKTNGNRDRWKHLSQGYVDAGNTNPVPNHLETPLVDREPMEIEIAGKVGIQTEAAAKSWNVDRSGTEAPVFVDRLSAKIDFVSVDTLLEWLQIGEFEASFMCQKIQLVTNRTIKLLFTEKLFLMISSKPKAWTRAESTWK